MNVPEDGENAEPGSESDPARVKIQWTRYTELEPNPHLPGKLNKNTLIIHHYFTLIPLKAQTVTVNSNSKESKLTVLGDLKDEDPSTTSSEAPKGSGIWIRPDSPAPRDMKSCCWSMMAAAAAAAEDLVAPEIWWLRSLAARVEESWSNW